MTDTNSVSNESDEALVERLYELTRHDDQAERARVDAMVYQRLLRAYGEDQQASAQD